MALLGDDDGVAVDVAVLAVAVAVLAVGDAELVAGADELAVAVGVGVGVVVVGLGVGDADVLVGVGDAEGEEDETDGLGDALAVGSASHDSWLTVVAVTAAAAKPAVRPSMPQQLPVSRTPPAAVVTTVRRVRAKRM